MKFTDFDLKSTIQQSIDEAGFKEPSPVQKEAIPLILEGQDIIAQAQTGTGKTAAFGLPMMNQMKADGSIEGLVIVPTRELAMQVSDELYRFGKLSGLKTATVYGGTAYGKQIERIKQASIVVATPGRLQDLLESGRIKMSPSVVVLDEADEMLDMGFLDEIKNIFTFIPKDRQTLMFSATMPKAIRRLAEEILNRPKTISITKAESTNTNISQHYYVVQDRERDDALVRLIDYKTPTKCIIFCRMKKEVDRLVSHLTSQGFKVSGLHGDMEQKQREVTIRGFKQGGIDIFVATDVAARGLDVNDVTHVFNYHIPFDSESYVHRIGRTGRAGKTGEAITLVSPNELRTIKRIEKDVGAKLVTQVIPTRQEVQNSKSNELIAAIANTQITEDAINLVKTLQHDLDIVTIAHLLASRLQESHNIKGKDNIGLGLEEIELLIERAMQNRGNSRNRSGSRRRRSGGSNDRNRRNSRSGGGGGHRGQRNSKPRRD
ncbi:MAG: DEAD/DEAH box helicase [Campylobacterota bacterium]|nr:DEAD/DEAH box helicase [Campylobacterota bacterium]